MHQYLEMHLITLLFTTGRCVEHCEGGGECSCGNNTDALCRVCCLDDNNNCVVMGPLIQDGRPCPFGFCRDGSCRPHNNDSDVSISSGRLRAGQQDIQTEEDTSQTNTILITLGIVIAVIAIAMVLVIGLAKVVRRSPSQEEQTEEEKLEELRRILHEALGSFNRSDDYENDADSNRKIDESSSTGHEKTKPKSRTDSLDDNVIATAEKFSKVKSKKNLH